MIKHIRRASYDEWTRILDADPTATYFHSPEWYDTWHEYNGMAIDTRLIEFSNGKQAILPLGYRSYLTGLIKKYISSPAGTYGGYIAGDSFDLSEKQVLNEYLIREFPVLRLRINPFSRVMDGFTGWSVKDFTQYVDLSAGFENNFRKWTHGHKSAVRKGLRDGVKVSPARELSEWKDYFRIYKGCQERWGKRASGGYSWKLFEILYYLNSKNIKLWLARDREQIISGAIIFYQGIHAAGWHGVTNREYFSLKPFHVLQYHIIKHAAEHGFKIYDMNPSSGYAGIENFKKSFNTIRKDTHVYINQGRVTGILLALKRRFV